MIENEKYVLDDYGNLTFKRGISRVNSNDIPTNVVLNRVIFPNGVTHLGQDLFENNNSVKEVILPNTLIEIGSGAFRDTDLQSISIPDSVQIIGRETFLNCTHLQSVKLPKNLTQIADYTFCSCTSLTNIEIPNSVEIVYNGAFGGSGLRGINIPNGVVKIKKDAFGRCTDLQIVTLPKSLKELDFSTVFLDCSSLKKLFIDSDNTKYLSFDNVVYSKDLTSLYFCPTTKTGEFVVPEGVKTLEPYCFADCDKLDNIIFPQSLEIVKRGAIQGCSSLKSLYFPNGVNKIEYSKFLPNPNLEYYSVPITVTFDMNTRNFDLHNPNLAGHFLNDLNAFVRYNDVELSTQGRNFNIKDGPYGMVLRDELGNVYIPDRKGNIIKTTETELLSKATKWNKIAETHSIRSYYTQLYEWNKYKDVPYIVVVERMPINEIQYFYHNNNFKNWQLISKTANFKDDVHKASLFDIAHALGVFSPNGTDSKVATEYIIKNIISKYSGDEIHEFFGGFDTPNTEFNAEFAKFFMKNFASNPQFLTFEDNLSGVENDMLAPAHNNFKQVLEVLPNKKELTPEMVYYALAGAKYKNIDERAQDLAEVVGKFGYSQEAFETLQNWFIQGESIPEEELTLKVKPDDSTKLVQYEMLAKNDPNGSILGNITNCCQVVGGTGEDCVKYGMTQPNSAFVVFKVNERILGQAWVWYDRDNKQITLDNIEVPKNINLELLKDRSLQTEFLQCLDRLGNNFIETMRKNNNPVDLVTIGTGFNDVNKILMPKYEFINNPNMLTNYNGYSDARASQLVLAGLSKNKTNELNQEMSMQ